MAWIVCNMNCIKTTPPFRYSRNKNLCNPVDVMIGYWLIAKKITHWQPFLSHKLIKLMSLLWKTKQASFVLTCHVIKIELTSINMVSDVSDWNSHWNLTYRG